VISTILVHIYYHSNVSMRYSIRLHRVTASAAPPALRHTATGKRVEIPENVPVTIATSPSATIQIAEHPKLSHMSCSVYMKASRLFARVDDVSVARSSDDTDDSGLGLGLLTADSHVYLEGSQMRLGVDYMVSPDATLRFGEVDGEGLVAEFDEAERGDDGLSRMLLQGMASTASQSVREALNDKL